MDSIQKLKVLSKKNVLVVGGAGYIGSHVAKALAHSNYQPIVIDDLSAGYESFVKWGPLIKLDIRNDQQLRDALAKVDFCATIHLAGHIEVQESMISPLKYYSNNVGGSISLLKVLRERAPLAPIIFSSTAAVYGQPGINLITETQPREPINPYGASKAMVEKILEDCWQANELPIGILRYFNVAGADPDCEIGESHQPETHLIPKLFESAKVEKATFKLFGNDYPTPDGTCIRDYVHVSDLANAHVLAVQSLLENPRLAVYNVGYSRGFTVLEILETIQKVCRVKINYQNYPRRQGDPAILIADSTKILNELNWKPNFSNNIEATVRHAWNWFCNGQHKVKKYLN